MNRSAEEANVAIGALSRRNGSIPFAGEKKRKKRGECETHLTGKKKRGKRDLALEDQPRAQETTTKGKRDSAALVHGKRRFKPSFRQKGKERESRLGPYHVDAAIDRSGREASSREKIPQWANMQEEKKDKGTLCRR